jgi:hypothetical protein
MSHELRLYGRLYGRTGVIGKIINIGPEKQTLVVIDADTLPKEFLKLAERNVLDCGDAVPSLLQIFVDALTLDMGMKPPVKAVPVRWCPYCEMLTPPQDGLPYNCGVCGRTRPGA